MEIILVLILILLRRKGGKTAIRIVSHYCSVVNNTYVYCRKEILLWKKRSTVCVSLSKIISDWERLPSPCWRLLNSYLCAGIISLNPYITPKRKDCPHFAGSIEVRWLLQGQPGEDPSTIEWGINQVCLPPSLLRFVTELFKGEEKLYQGITFFTVMLTHT